MKILDYSKYFLLISAVAVVASIVAIAIFGLKPGIEFTGGSILGVEYAAERPSLESVRSQLNSMDIGLVSAQEAGERGIIFRMRDLPEEQHQAVLTALGQDVNEVRFESIGPVIGKELREKSFILLVLVLGSITFYIMFAFRKMKQPVHSWRWSFAALVALLHDMLIPLGVLAVLGALYGEQITIPVVVALLTVAGYSVNDTVVIFDRIRENYLKRVGTDFADTVRKGLEQTLVRSVNTSITVLLVVFAIVLFGGETIRPFALTLAIGFGAGVWSSLFVAPYILTRKGKFGLI